MRSHTRRPNPYGRAYLDRVDPMVFRPQPDRPRTIRCTNLGAHSGHRCMLEGEPGSDRCAGHADAVPFPHEPLRGVELGENTSVGPEGSVTLTEFGRCRWCTVGMSFAEGRAGTQTCTVRAAQAARDDRREADAEQDARDTAIRREAAVLRRAREEDAARRATWQH